MRTGKIKIVLEYNVYESYKTKHVISLNKKTVEGDEELAKPLLKRIYEGYKVETCSDCGSKNYYPLGWSGVFMCDCSMKPCEKCGMKPIVHFNDYSGSWIWPSP